LRLFALAVSATVLAAAAVACGGGDSTGSDDQYVKDFCTAQRDFKSSLDEAVKEVAAGGGSVDAGKIAEPYSQLAKDFEDMKPPADIKDWHNGASKQLRDAASRIKKEKSLQSIGQDPLTGMPAEARERLRKVAQNEQACNGLNVFQG
jgi:hypothetical protein